MLNGAFIVTTVKEAVGQRNVVLGQQSALLVAGFDIAVGTTWINLTRLLSGTFLQQRVVVDVNGSASGDHGG